MASEPFDVRALHALIDSALAQPESVLPHASGSVGGDGTAPAVPLPLTLLNTRIFTVFSALLAKYLPAADHMQALDDLRDQLYAGLDTGTARTFYTQVLHCRACPSVDPKPILPTGNRADPDLMIVHEGPWPTGDADRFTAALTEVGFAPDRLVHTSVVRCRPCSPRPATEAEVAQCSPYLLAEIQLVRPKLVLLAGATALGAIAGAGLTITAERGTMFMLGPWMFLPTYAVGSFAHHERYYTECLADLRVAHRLCYGGA